MTRIPDLHRRCWRQGADYKDAYDALAEEVDLARSLTDARTAAGCSQSQSAETMKTSRHLLARIRRERELLRLTPASHLRNDRGHQRIVFEPQPAR